MWTQFFLYRCCTLFFFLLIFQRHLKLLYVYSFSYPYAYLSKLGKKNSIFSGDFVFISLHIFSVYGNSIALFEVCKLQIDQLFYGSLNTIQMSRHLNEGLFLFFISDYKCSLQLNSIAYTIGEFFIGLPLNSFGSKFNHSIGESQLR